MEISVQCIVAEVTLTLGECCGLITMGVCCCNFVFLFCISSSHEYFLTPLFPGIKLIYVDRFSFTVSQKNKLLDWLCTCFKDINFFIIEETKTHCSIWDISQPYDFEPSFWFALGSQAYQKNKVSEVWVWRHMKVTPVCVTPLPGFPFSVLWSLSSPATSKSILKCILPRQVLLFTVELSRTDRYALVH